MAKKCPEGEECPEWIFTFADLVMLMMGFFVILWVLKPNPTKSPGEAGETAGAAGAAAASPDEKWLQTVGEIRKGFGYHPQPGSKDPVDMAIERKRRQLQPPSFQGPGQGGESKDPQQSPKGTDPLVTIVRPGKYVAVGGRLSFEAGQSALVPETRRSLDEVAKIIRGHRNIVQVKGHTSLDDLPEGATPQQQMELSLRRAQAAADYLIAGGVAPDIVRVQGCSTFEPVAQHVYAPGAQAVNRRVEVEATDQLVEERQDLSRSPETPLQPTTAPAQPASLKVSHGKAE